MNKLILRDVIITTLLLGLFAAVGAALVAWVHARTEARIIENQIALTRARVAQLLTGIDYDNDPIAAQHQLRHPLLGPNTTPVWFALQDDEVVGLVVAAITTSGYSGAIHLLVGLDPAGQILGVRVTQHRETPGLGDDIEVERSNWIHTFVGRHLANPPLELWRVRRDGGIFDQFTGATVTPRAVVHAVRDVLVYFDRHSDDLLALGRPPEPDPGEAELIEVDPAIIDPRETDPNDRDLIEDGGLIEMDPVIIDPRETDPSDFDLTGTRSDPLPAAFSDHEFTPSGPGTDTETNLETGPVSGIDQ